MDKPTLKILHRLPEGFLDVAITELYQLLPEPTLIHLAGQRPEPLFVSTLLHGNETTSFLALQALLKKYQHHALPRSLSIFVGNVEAARYGLRHLEDQSDYNRVWPHVGFQPDAPETIIMQQVIDEMKQRNVFLSIDIHNNTGLNPHYACINRLNNAFYQLAVLFSRTVIYFTTPRGVQSQAFAEFCPSVTIECGKIGNEAGTAHALEYLESCLTLAALPDRPMLKQDIDLFHTTAVVKIPDHIRYSFTDPEVDFLLSKQLETMNFSELPLGSVFGSVRDGIRHPLSVMNEVNEEVFDKYFVIDNQKLQTTSRIMPSMLTTDVDVIHKDCLCYLMERLHLEE